MPPPDRLFHEAVYLTGATASGKTAVGVELALRLGAEILALDSVTVYRGMDVGAAKPTVEERRGVPHHLIDVIDPWESAGVAFYLERAKEVLADIRRRGRTALFVGGTPLYLKACLRGLFEGPGADPELRRELEAEADRDGDVALHERLRGVDPETAARLHPNDRRRVVRALEVLAATGRPIGAHQLEHDRPAPATVPVFALSRPRAVARERIDRRVERMFAEGLVDEVRRLKSLPRPWNPVPAQAVGYFEVSRMLDGLSTEAEAVEKTKARTRQFAKRQETWFRSLAEVRPLIVPDDEAPEATARRLADEIRSGPTTPAPA